MNVKIETAHATTQARKSQVKAILLEGLFVAVTGAAFAFGANAISPRGLALARNYFPGAIRNLPPAVAATKARARRRNQLTRFHCGTRGRPAQSQRPATRQS